MALTMSVDWATIAVVVALGAALWRHLSNLDKRLTNQMSDLMAQVGRLAERISHLEGVVQATSRPPYAAGVQTREGE